MTRASRPSPVPRPQRNARVIYDVLYGFIPITEWEEEIINSPFFQRLRWIKQLGFANYIFPGAEHNRFAHTIGVMNSMEQMIRALGLNVPDSELFNRKATNDSALLHKTLRIAALLHDIGTFPFSHAIEFAYMRHGNDSRRGGKDLKRLPNSHEHLGSFIIKNTDFEGGITRILKEYGFDIQMLSDIIKGKSKHLIANQLMHSDMDADRMDYLMRDSYYTGIKYGQFDRDYILANLVTYDAGNGELGYGVRPNATHAVEDFLVARFWWYSQVVKNPGSAKFDVMSSYIAEKLLEQDDLFQFQDLLDLAASKNERFLWWNDIYFMNRCLEVKLSGKVKDPQLSELLHMLLYRKPPKTLHDPLFAHRIIDSEFPEKDRESLVRELNDRVAYFRDQLAKYGTGKEWLLVDIPHKDVSFTARPKRRSRNNIATERDPVKVVRRDGSVELLIDQDNSLVKRISGYINFVPSVYANEEALQLLKRRKAL